MLQGNAQAYESRKQKRESLRLSLSRSCLFCLPSPSRQLGSICFRGGTPCGRDWLLPGWHPLSFITSGSGHYDGEGLCPCLRHMSPPWTKHCCQRSTSLAACPLLGSRGGSASRGSRLVMLVIWQQQWLPRGLGLRLGGDHAILLGRLMTWEQGEIEKFPEESKRTGGTLTLKEESFHKKDEAMAAESEQKTSKVCNFNGMKRFNSWE